MRDDVVDLRSGLIPVTRVLQGGETSGASGQYGVEKVMGEARRGDAGPLRRGVFCHSTPRQR